MNERLKYIAKLSLSALLSFLKIYILTTLSTVLVAIIGFILIAKNIDVGTSARVSIIPFLIVVFTTKTMSAILWCLVFFGSPFLFFALANKYVLLKLSNKVITDKSDDVILPILEKAIQKFQEKKPVVLKNLEEYSLHKMKLIQEIRENPAENKWLKRVVVFALKKVRLDDIDFSDEQLDFFDIIKIKTIQFLQNITKPKRSMIWIPILIQWAILVFIFVANY
jgi:hypothetical protein